MLIILKQPNRQITQINTFEMFQQEKKTTTHFQWKSVLYCNRLDYLLKVNQTMSLLHQKLNGLASRKLFEISPVRCSPFFIYIENDISTLHGP